MFTGRSKDRRRSYSFGGRCYRVRHEKGRSRTWLSRVATSVALASMALVGCDSPPITRALSPGKPTALVISTPDVRETIAFETSDPCPPFEPIQATLETRQTADFDGQTPHQTVHMRWRFAGTGLSGASYNGSGEHNEEVNANLNVDKFEWTTNDEFRIFATNSLDEAIDDFVMHANFHITLFFSPPRMTSHVDNFYMDCR